MNLVTNQNDQGLKTLSDFCRGRWQFQASNLTLQFENPEKHWWYEIDLEDITSSHNMLDWILHLHGKRNDLITPQDLHDLVSALKAIFGAGFTSQHSSEQWRSPKVLEFRDNPPVLAG